MSYATKWQCSRARSSSLSGCKHANAGHTLLQSCRRFGRVVVVGQALEGGVEKRRHRKPRRQTSPWSCTTTLRLPKTAITENPDSRSASQWLFHRLVDMSSRSPGDSTTLWREVSCWSCVAFVAKVELELPEAGTPRTRARRIGDWPLASANLASPKKRARVEKLALSSRTRAVLCFSPRAVAPGRRADKRPCSIVGTGMIACRQPTSSPSLRNVVASGCIFVCSKGTCARKTWCRWCDNCIVTCGGRSFWYGTVPARTAKRRDCFWRTIRPGCGSSGCRPTPPILTRPSNVGIRPRTPTWQTSCQMTWNICGNPCGNRSCVNVATKTYSARTSRPPN